MSNTIITLYMIVIDDNNMIIPRLIVFVYVLCKEKIPRGNADIVVKLTD